MNSKRAPLIYTILAVVAAVVTLYCFSGVVMNGHFAMGANRDEHLLAARIFAALTLLSLIATVAFVLAAVRHRRKRKTCQ